MSTQISIVKSRFSDDYLKWQMRRGIEIMVDANPPHFDFEEVEEYEEDREAFTIPEWTWAFQDILHEIPGPTIITSDELDDVFKEYFFPDLFDTYKQHVYRKPEILPQIWARC